MRLQRECRARVAEWLIVSSLAHHRSDENLAVLVRCEREGRAAFPAVDRYQHGICSSEPLKIGLTIVADHERFLAVFQANTRSDRQRLTFLVGENDYRCVIVVLGSETHYHAA